MDILQSFVASSDGSGNGIAISNKHLEKAQQYLAQFDKLGVRAGMEKMLACCFDEMAMVGPSGAVGILDKNAFNTKVLIPLLVTHTGLMLTLEQKGTLKLLTSLVSVRHQPEHMPMKSPTFILKYKSHKQTIAIQGNSMSTKVPTAGSFYYNIETQLSKRFAGFTVGDLDFLFENETAAVIEELAERMEKLNTTWGITTIHFHAAYAAAQPSVSQLMLANKILHQPQDSYAKLLQYCFIEHLMCGSLNRSPANIKTILAEFGHYLKLNENKEFVVVFPQESAVGAMSYAIQEPYNANRKVITYNTVGPSLEQYCTFGSISVTESEEPVMVHSLALPNGCKAMLVPIGGLPGEENCAAPLVTEGYKKVFFTVGGCPSIYESKCSPAYFDGCTGEINPKSVTEACPDTTYFMDFDRNCTAKMTLSDCHKLTNHDGLFMPRPSYDSWLKVFKKEMLGFVDERKTAALLTGSKEDLLASPLMTFETDPRNMWIVDSHNSNTATVKFATANTNPSGAPEYVYLVNRGVLGNASPCSRFQNEVVASIGGLATVVKSFTTNLTDLVDRMTVDLENISVDAVLNFRKLKVSAMTAADMLNALKTAVSGVGIFSDPTCQVVYSMLCTKAFVTQDNALQAYIETNNAFIHKMLNMINSSMKESASIISTVFASQLYNAIMGATEPLVVLRPSTDFEIPDKFTNYLKFMYGFVMPAISKKVAVGSGVTYTGNILQASVAERLLGLGSHLNGVFVPESYATTTMDLMAPYGVDDSIISIMRPLFKTRIEMLTSKFAGIPMVIVLGLIHYWTVWNTSTVKKHMDKTYYSGLSYICIRNMHFMGHTVSAMPIEGARFITGNKWAGFPMATWQQTDYKQAMELLMVPYDIASTGITATAAFLSNIRGMGAATNLDLFPNGIIVLDSYNCYLPEGMRCHQSGLSMLPVQGRFEKPDMNKQDISGLFCELPTAFFKASLMLELTRENNRGYSPNSSLGLMDAALAVDDFMDGVPQCVRLGIDEGFGHKEILNQVVGANKAPSSIFTKQFGGMFTDDYVVGVGSSALLKMPASTTTKFNSELMPRIYSIGGLNANAIFGAEAQDPAFMSAFVAQFSVAKVSNYRNF